MPRAASVMILNRPALKIALAALTLRVAFGCAPHALDDAGLPDAGGHPQVVDGGDLTDAGEEQDSGEWIDAGSGDDAGAPDDAGVVSDDAGAPPDAGPVDPNHCGSGDINLLGKEPALPTSVCQTIAATKSAPDESALDTATLQAALDACRGLGAVKLVTDGGNDTFVSGPLTVASQTLWVDDGVTLYASRTPSLYTRPGMACGAEGVDEDDSGKQCFALLTLSGTAPAIVGGGTIDGQGQEPLVGNASQHSWWDLSQALRSAGGSAPNPALIETSGATSGLVLYGVTLVNSPKFHVKFSGTGFVVWGLTILTPSRQTNSLGAALTPDTARNSDGIDPGSGGAALNGVIACNTVSTGDDQLAIKGATNVNNLLIAHNHFGTGHGLSIGSETQGGVSNVRVYDLTIDADSRASGTSSSGNSNGLRIKSDASRGGLVTGITYEDICLRDLVNPIVVNAHYSSSSGSLLPTFTDLTFRRVRSVRGASPVNPAVTFQGYDAAHVTTATLDAVVIDQITKVNNTYAAITVADGGANFNPMDGGVAAGPPVAPACVFPTLPVPR